MISALTGGSAGMTAPMHRKRFHAMDKNCDGSLDKSELAGMAKRTGKSADDLMAALDTNKDGKVDALSASGGAHSGVTPTSQAFA